LGISTSLESVSRVIAPSAGGFLLNLGAWAPGVVSAALMLWVVYFTYRRIIGATPTLIGPSVDISKA
jgi:DHA1 family tetracycline resistance protein-like MFS transporter